MRTMGSCLAGALIAGGVLVDVSGSGAGAEDPSAPVEYSCDGGKTISATYYKDRVEIVLSDGRSMQLPQVMSGSGARYANSGETFVFWNKGNTAFITEG